MRKLTLAVLLFTAWATLAETAGFVFPLTNTRYGAAGATGLLRTDGAAPFVFWTSFRDIRVTKIVEGQNRSGEVVFAEQTAFDAVWTGTHFLAVTTRPGQPQATVIGRLVDGQGHPTGEPFEIVPGGHTPRLAAGHGAVLMVYETLSGSETRAQLLTPNGQLSGSSVLIAPQSTRYAVTATANGFAVITSDAQTITATSLDAQGRVFAQNSLARPGNFVDVFAVSRGPRSLVVWSDVDRLEASILDNNGVLGAPLLVDNVPPDPLEPIYPVSATAVWNGNGWSVGYQAGRQSPRVRVAHLDSQAQTVVSREESAPGLRNPSLAVVGNRVLATWTPTALGQLEPVWIGAVPLGPSQSYPVTFAALEQYLAATASSVGGMLAVWTERGDRRETLRSGVRTHSGQWSEHQVSATAPSRALAQSDGRNFVIFATFGTSPASEAIFLDEDGRPTGLRVALPRPVEAAAWSGTHYALIDTQGDVRLLTPTGTLSAPANLGVEWTGWDIASHGNGFLVIGGRVECQFLLCFPRDVRALRLDANGQRVGVEHQLAPEGSYPHRVVWNGTEYIVVWTDGTRIGFSRLSPTIDTAPVTDTRTMQINPVSIAPTSAGVAVLDIRQNVREVKYFTSGGTLYTTASIADTSSPNGNIDLVPLYGETMAYVASPARSGPPHHGAPRVSVAIVAGPRIAQPLAPQVTVREVDDRFVIDWTRPTGVVNGYRLEYRIDDGNWIEYERWFAPAETNIAIRKPSFGSTFVFRVRAINDTGTGPYSNEAMSVGRKRRAVR